MTYKAIDDAMFLLTDYYETEGIPVDYNSMLERVESWYNHTDVTDPKILAGAAVESGFFCGATYNYMKTKGEQYFSDDMIEFRHYYVTYNEYFNDLYSIGDIEEAERDAEWWG